MHRRNRGDGGLPGHLSHALKGDNPMRRAVLVLVAALLPALAIAQAPPPPDNVEVTITAANPSGSCSKGRFWINSTTGASFACYGGTWNDFADPGAGVSFPLQAPSQSTDLILPYGFADCPACGFFYDNATGFLTFQTSGAADLEQNYLQMVESAANGYAVTWGSFSDAGNQASTFYARAAGSAVTDSGWGFQAYNFADEGLQADSTFTLEATGIPVWHVTAQNTTSTAGWALLFNDLSGLPAMNLQAYGASANPAIDLSFQPGNQAQLTYTVTGLTEARLFLDEAQAQVKFTDSGNSTSSELLGTADSLRLQAIGYATLTETYDAGAGTIDRTAVNGSNTGRIYQDIGAVELVATGTGLSTTTRNTQGLILLTQTTSGNTSSLQVVGGTGIEVVTTGSKPTCDAGAHRRLWYTANAGASDDTFEVCRQLSGGSYAWVSLLP